MATTGMPSLRASVTAMCSLRVSTTQTAAGGRVMSRMPPRLRSSFSRSWRSRRTSFLGLLLGADEQHRAALGDRVPQERERGLDRLHGLLEVDDVDAVALAVDVARENPGPGGR